MNIEHYQDYEKYQEKGLKKDATRSLRAFISSFEDDKEIEEWVCGNLPELAEKNHSQIRYEIFKDLVYPVLKKGYLNNDLESTLWLAKLFENVSREQDIELGDISDLYLYNKCYEIDPNNNEVRLTLLYRLVDWLKFSEHEWPQGILYGMDGATLEQCEEISSVIERIITLDRENKYSEPIKQYEKKLVEYRERLIAYHKKSNAGSSPERD